MSNLRHHPTGRFNAPTSFLLLPSFRRPSYREMYQIDVPEEPDKSSVFHQWTLEGDSPLYATINKALLNDDQTILREHIACIYNLRMAIKHNHQPKEITVYRNLKLQPSYVQEEYKEGATFLWPTFSSTSLDRSVASKFGNYRFEIKASPADSTYRTNISGYSKFPEEQEVLFYPCSGFRVKKIVPDARIIQLECVDTLNVEAEARSVIPEKLKLFDDQRQMIVYLLKDSNRGYWANANAPDKVYGLPDLDGYWDSRLRYHHRNGYYFVKKGDNLWEEYQNNQLFASFKQV